MRRMPNWHGMVAETGSDASESAGDTPTSCTGLWHNRSTREAMAVATLSESFRPFRQRDVPHDK